MNVDILKSDLIQYAAEIGIDKIGFTTAEPFLELKVHLQEHQEKGYASGFEESDIEKRIYPELTLPNAKSIIAIALAYPTKIEDGTPREDGVYRGFVARSAWGRDYHHVLREKLELLATYLKKRVPDFQYESMVDTGVLSDRAVAERAGIGWVGKNANLITLEYGSYVYLGEMITNIPFSPDEPMPNMCGDCKICLERCPTQAFVQPGQLNAKECLAYVTQVKNFIDDKYRDKLGNRVYGCDTCQQVCPYNRRIHFNHQVDFRPDPELARPDLIPLLKIRKREFNETWGPTAAAWRGRKPIQRNAIIALAHYKDQQAVPELIQLLEKDVRPAIRGTAAWALGKIGGEEAQHALEVALKKEKDELVRVEIEKGMRMLVENVNLGEL